MTSGILNLPTEKMMLECVSIPVMCLVVFFHQGVGGEDVRSVTGYTDESVVLPSDADPSWTLRRIRWSIYDNLTYIAVFQSGQKSVDHLPLFTKRLELNTTSGDLTIKNVSLGDALTYRVELLGQKENQRKTSYVQLSVEEQLGKPSIRLLHNILDAEECVISLECQRTPKNGQISFSWTAENFNDTLYWDSPAESGKSVLWTTFKPNRKVTFSCITAAGNRSQSSSRNVMCKVLSHGKAPLSVLKLLSSVVAASPYVLATILAVKCYRARTKPDEDNRPYRVIEAEASV